MASRATLLLLADGRLPAGGHAHSGGLEAAVASGRVHDVASLEGFLRGRLATTGLVGAAFAAAACHRPGDAAGELDGELDARTPSAALRRASRAQGRALLRAGRALWTIPDAAADACGAGQSGPDDLHQAVALGVVAAAAGLDAADAAVVAAYGLRVRPAGAAVRLLVSTPYPVHALLARLAPTVDAVAAEAAAYRDIRAAELPAASAPLLDISAEDHATWEVRLFAS